MKTFSVTVPQSQVGGMSCSFSQELNKVTVATDKIKNSFFIVMFLMINTVNIDRSGVTKKCKDKKKSREKIVNPGLLVLKKNS